MPRVERQGRARVTNTVRAIVATVVCVIFLIPVIWMGLSALKPRAEIVTVPPKVFFQPSLDGFVGLFTQRVTIKKNELEEFQERTDLNLFERISLERGMKIVGPSQFVGRLQNSIIISAGSTFLALILSFLAAYAFSRFRFRGHGDLSFYILSTRMMPPVVVTIPIFLMYRWARLFDTHLGMILLYTMFNLSLATWLLMGFLDEIPREYEEAAMVDGYSRWRALLQLVLPQAWTGIATTAVFCLIFTWNDYAFGLMLTAERARTAPVSLPGMISASVREWGSTTAGTLLFLFPVAIVAFAVRRYLIRGITFGAIRK